MWRLFVRCPRYYAGVFFLICVPHYLLDCHGCHAMTAGKPAITHATGDYFWWDGRNRSMTASAISSNFQITRSRATTNGFFGGHLARAS